MSVSDRVARGWGPLAYMQMSKSELEARLAERFPAWKAGKVGNAASQLFRFMLEHYERLDERTRELVPLTRLYWPVVGDGE